MKKLTSTTSQEDILGNVVTLGGGIVRLGAGDGKASSLCFSHGYRRFYDTGMSVRLFALATDRNKHPEICLFARTFPIRGY